MRTLLVLQQLNQVGKATLLQYLYTSQLINRDNTIINLVNADLSGADLENLSLENANLSGTNLRFANLRNANLFNADLSRSDLSGANLKSATGITTEELEKQAKSLKDAIMPNGSKHP